ncbi:MAG: hypothetical protein U5R30_15250 [Deltaproteobacteria bacterium]|nr:hypothetical protein [Deltaproteobacteria bacterium]
MLAEEGIMPQLMFQPLISHLTLQAGESVDFSVTFRPTPTLTQYTGLLTVSGADQQVTLSTQFGCPQGTALYDVILSNVYACLKTHDWYCTNKKRNHGSLQRCRRH